MIQNLANNTFGRIIQLLIVQWYISLILVLKEMVRAGTYIYSGLYYVTEEH